MAYQLWTSPITGYRRTGTRFADVRKLFEDGITVKAIFEPLKSCPANERVFLIEEAMRTWDFDVLGVREGENSPVIGYVLRSDLKTGFVRDHLRKITPEMLITESTPIAELISLLPQKSFLFVLNKTKVEGIVTQADLNKPPVRIYLFGLISLLEMHIGYWVRNQYEEDTWQSVLSQTRINKAQQLFDERKKRNQEIDLFDCLQFCDKSSLLLKNEVLRHNFSIQSIQQGKNVLESAEGLRNSLAHSQEDISQEMNWSVISDSVVWIENFISTSDNLIENFASESSEGFNDNLM